MFASAKNIFSPPNMSYCNTDNDYVSYFLLNLSKASFGYIESN